VTGIIVLAFLCLAVVGLTGSQPRRPTAGRSAAPSGAPSITPTAATLVMGGTGATEGILVSAAGQALYYNEQDTPNPRMCSAS
jgi:hypothetical protein